MKSLYAQYVKEREGLDLLEKEEAFLTYTINADQGYIFIQDLYVIPEKRRSQVASQLADEVVSIAVQQGCSILYGQVDTRANQWERSAKVLEGYGMSAFKTENSMIYFKKNIG
jgi:GNAT superfamily N-acetyltransferase